MLNLIISNMATVKNFEDLEIWKNARILTKQVYEDFFANKDFGFRDQVQRAAVSIMNNTCLTAGRLQKVSAGVAMRNADNFLNFPVVQQEKLKICTMSRRI